MVIIAVNNVGQSYDMPSPYHELDFERVKSLVALNVSAAAEMTHWALPKMLTLKKGLIINVSSGSAIVPAPLLALYSGTKAFLDTFSVALAHEYEAYSRTFTVPPLTSIPKVPQQGHPRGGDRALPHRLEAQQDPLRLLHRPEARHLCPHRPQEDRSLLGLEPVVHARPHGLPAPPPAPLLRH